jgi:PAS domain S-box-containing protein
MRELIAPEFRSEFDSYLRQIAQVGEARGFLAVMTRSGERRVWQYHNTLRTEGVASPIVRGMAHDVTDQKRAENLLRTAGELNRQIIASSSEGVAVYDRNLRCLAWNPFMEKLTGIPASVALGKPSQDLIPKMKRHDAELALKRALQGEMITSPDEELADAGGKQRWISGCKSPLRDAQGEIAGVIVTLRDITERKHAEARLQASEDRYRAVHDRSPVGICWVEAATGRFLTVNSKYCEIAGRTEQDLLGRDFQSITHPEDLAENCEKLRQLAKGKLHRYEMEKRYVRPDGSIRWAEVAVVAMGAQGAPPVWLMAMVQDVTERKRSEERRREYERVVEGSEEMIVVVDRDYRYVIANRAYLNYRSLSKEQVIGCQIGEIVNEESLTIIQPKLDECFQGKVVYFAMKCTYPNLGERDLWVSYFPVEGSRGVDRVVCVLQDITERRRGEERLRRSEENYRMFVTQSSEGIFREEMDAPVSLDLPEDELIHHILHDSYLAECNDAMARMYGVDSGRDLVGKRLTEMLVAGDPQNIELTRDYIRSGFRVLERVSHEIDIHGNPKVFLNSMIGTVENGMLVRTWGIQRDVTETMKLEEARRRSEEALQQNVAQLREVTEELRVAQEKLSEEKLYLEQAIDTELGFGEIIGRSGAVKEVMQKVAKVAPSDATVLLLGETGTGKELVARALHRLSKRQGNSFIKMNCAAIPSGLLESELFGHERGAFTGAVARKLGRLELADRGTLFLDEVGEIPLNLQPKLLRVLQDLEFERLGGTQTLRVNFRLVAATNRDLMQSVKEREFRADLYYRLNVFPIVIPPLRERREDVRPLIEHFVGKFANRMKKSITSIPSRTMEILVRWDWPGNIRELENFVERSVILTPGSVLQAPLSELQAAFEAGDGKNSDSLRDKERERILRALRDCSGRLGGPDGAAARLGLKRTTLQSKLDHLGIKPGAYRA